MSPKRIMLVIHSLLGGGAERVTVSLANAWSARGDSVDIVTFGTEETSYPVSPAVRLTGLCTAARSEGFVSGLLGNFRRLLALRREIRLKRPDIVIGMMSATSVLVALAGMGLPARTIGAERIYPPLLPLGRIWTGLRRFLYRYLDAVTAQTDVAARWLQQHTSARNIHVVPNPIIFPLPNSLPHIPPETCVRPDRRVLLAMGRLVPQKGFSDLITVFGELAPRYPDWNLVILGEGPARQALEERIAAYGLTGRAILPGHAGNVAEWLGRAQLFVMTSRFEGFPNALMEAMAAGVPAISYDCLAGPAVIIRHGIDGFLVPVNDMDRLAWHLRLVMDDVPLRDAMAAAALQVRERFSLASALALWDQIFATDSKKQP